VTGAAVLLPLAFDLEAGVVEQEDAARPIAVRLPFVVPHLMQPAGCLTSARMLSVGGLAAQNVAKCRLIRLTAAGRRCMLGLELGGATQPIDAEPTRPTRSPSCLPQPGSGLEHRTALDGDAPMYQDSFSPSANFLIGREAEVREIHALLTDSACHLVTLVGPGGIGKTTLAIHLVANLRAVFPGGVAFVPLQAVQTPDFIAPAIADAIGLTLAGTGEPLAQVCQYLHDKAYLVVLDNLEHLLAGLDILTTLLHRAPACKLLVTSREALSLREEWLYSVPGLAYPQATAADAPADYAAIQLFADRARRVRRDFALADEYAGVVRICQLVEGMPLALELAATWTKTLRCDRIAAEIEQNLDFLSTRLRDLPERHHSIKAVFERSWALLSEGEQTIFTRLSVFRGGFDDLAAAQCAGASLAQLAALADKSLLRWEAGGRYQIHELLRQYGEEKLAANPDELTLARDAHCRYYTDFLYVRQHDMFGGRQREATAEIEAEIDNIRFAWQWALESYNVEAILRSMQLLGLFNQFRSRYREGIALAEQAVRTLESGSPTPNHQHALILLLVHLGWLYIRLGQLERAHEILERSRALYAAPDYIPLPGDATDPEVPLGLICLIKGDYAGAARLAEAARRRNAAHRHHNNLQYALYVLTGAARARGEYAEARHFAEQAYALTQERQNHWFMAYCLNELGQVEQALGNHDRAAQHYRTSYRLRQEFADTEGMAVALRHLGWIAMAQTQYAEARELFEQSRALYELINDQGGLASAFEGLGSVALELGDYETARHQLRAALELAVAIEFVPLIFALFIPIGAYFLQTGKPSLGLNLLVLTTRHPASERATKDRAAQFLARFQSAAELDLPAMVTPHEQEDTPATLAASLLTTLMLEPGGADPVSCASAQLLPPNHAGLLEPLSLRELEVLRLLAQGLSNPQIAEALIVSVGTVKTHTHNIFVKLGAANRMQAVQRAQVLHLV
jgi:predicted ATPase/DNA-binding CsgD family transcriptional regulator